MNLILSIVRQIIPVIPKYYIENTPVNKVIYTMSDIMSDCIIEIMPR